MLVSANQSNSSLAYSVSLAEHEQALQKIRALEAQQQESNNRIANLEAEIVDCKNESA